MATTTWTCPIFSSDPLIYQHCTDLGQCVAFTAKPAGNMSMTVLEPGVTAQDIAANRHDVERHLGIPLGRTRFVSQTHSDKVLTSGDHGWQERQTIGEGDAIISPDGSDPIAILVADCLPVAFTTSYGPTAVAHAGRVGLLDGILENTVQQLSAYDTNGTGMIAATIGPGICGSCYEVPETMRTEAATCHPNIASETSWGTPALDLPGAAIKILLDQGVNVHTVGECTFSNEQLYSHRREPGVGRLAGFVWSS